MEDSGCVYTRQETRLVACFPCKLAGFSPRSSLPLKDPEHPRESLNLSPKPGTNRARVRSLDGDERASPGSSLGRPSSGLLAPHQGARLALRADGVGEAKDTRGGERAQEFVESPGWYQVGGLRLERGADGFRVEVVRTASSPRSRAPEEDRCVR